MAKRARPQSALPDSVVDAARRGDRAALREIYLTLAPAVLGYLRAKGVEDPEAVTNDIFIVVLRRIDSVTGGAAGLRRFVFSVAHNRMVDDYRSRSRAPSLVPYEPADDTRHAPSAEEVAATELATDRVRAVLDLLPADQREVLQLRVVADLSVDQVAEIMGRSPGAVKQLQRRAIIALRAILDAQGAPR